MSPSIADLHITNLAAGGDGVARHDGLAVFVPRTAVGDVVRASLVSRGRFARGTVRSLVTGSADRVDPPCVHFEHDDCGGCQWQHLSVAAQRAAKAQLVADAFERIAGTAIPLPDVIGDATVFEYRRTVSFTVRGTGKQRVGGFHAASDPDAIVPIERCLIAHPALQVAWLALRPLLSRLPEWRAPAPDAPIARRGAARRGQRSSRQQQSLRVSLRRLTEGEIALVVEGGDRWSATAARAVADAVPGCRGVWWTPAGQEARLVWDRERATGGVAFTAATVNATDTSSLTEVASSAATDAASDLAVAASFVQVNANLADRLHAFVLSHVLALEPRHVVDAYAGAGRLTVALDEAGVRVTSIERDDRACRHASARIGPHSRVLAGTVESRLDEALPAEVIVLNPPRAGCDVAVCERLSYAASERIGSPRALVYVSCDPATLARDVGRLVGWRVASVTCFDMFPQTAHVETVCVLHPETS